MPHLDTTTIFFFSVFFVHSSLLFSLPTPPSLPLPPPPPIPPPLSTPLPPPLSPPLPPPLPPLLSCTCRRKKRAPPHERCNTSRKKMASVPLVRRCRLETMLQPCPPGPVPVSNGPALRPTWATDPRSGLVSLHPVFRRTWRVATRVPGKWSRRNPSIPKVMLVVLVERVIALLPMVCFAHRQQILAVSKRWLYRRMVLLW